ncbi:MAG: RICIN domain-containing protein [Planctomycetia bacterium]|nr:RICIN domain-containing protein [Planctomycetia bacterium]
MKTRALFALLFLFTAVALAQEKKESPKTDDPIAAQLLKDKEAHIAALEKAKGVVLKAFDKQYELVKNNKALKIDVQLAQLEKIEEEKKAFQENGVPPTLPALKVALSEYRTALKKAEGQCKLAFEKAAKAYRNKDDIKAASATLDEMKEFLAASGTAALPVVIMCGHANKVLGLSGGNTDDGTRVVTADYVKGDQTQLWKVVPAGDGWIYIENIKSGMVLTANGKNNGTEVIISKKDTPVSENQLWKLTPVPNVKDAIKVVPKPNGKPLGVFGKSRNSGAPLVLWTDENEYHRYFGFLPPK